MKRRHRIFYAVLRPFVIAFLFLRFGYRFRTADALPENYIVLSNHNTDYDPLLVGCSFRKYMTYVTSEHVFRWKLAGRLLRYVFAPIARYKGSTAASTVREILRTTRSGGSVCMFAEGDRSWDGVTGPILDSTGRMVKSSRCALVTYRIEGGYFVSPRWSAFLRRGRLYGAPVNVYSAEQLASMSAEEINGVIRADLHEDAYARQLESPAAYRGKAPAEYLETALFICPECGGLADLYSIGDELRCRCGFSCRYDEYGMLEGAPFLTVREWTDWQRERTGELLADGGITLAAADTVLSAVSEHTATPVDGGEAVMDAEALTIGKTSFPLAEISSLALYGRSSVVFTTHDGRYFELKAGPRQNTYKFSVLYGEYKKKAAAAAVR